MESEFNLKPQTPTASELLRERLIGFAKEYVTLCNKYNLTIDGCGCCGSPYLTEIEETKEAKQFNLHTISGCDLSDITYRIEEYIAKKIV